MATRAAVNTRVASGARQAPRRDHPARRKPAPARRPKLRWTPRPRNVLLWQVFLGAVVLCNLYFHVKIIESGLRIDGLKKELAQEKSVHQDLRVAALQSHSPTKIEEVARTKLQMVEPTGLRYLRMPPLPPPPVAAEPSPEPEKKPVSLGGLWAKV